MELFKTQKFDGTLKSILRRLNLSLQEAKDSVKRLERAGFLLSDAEGDHQLVDQSSSSILIVATSKAHREQQKQILEGAIGALEKTPIDERSQSSMTFAIDTQKLDEAKELIKKFRRQMGRLLSKSENLNEVYQLSVSLYPVSNNSKENR